MPGQARHDGRYGNRPMRELPLSEAGCQRVIAGALSRAGGDEMVLTRDFKDTVKERASRDADFARALLDEAATRS